MFDWHSKSSELTPKRIEIYKRLGVQIPEPPDYDIDIQSIIETYQFVARGRNYTEGQPLPLSVRNVTEVIEAHPIAICRSLLDPIIFAIDDLVLAEQRKPKSDG